MLGLFGINKSPSDGQQQQQAPQPAAPVSFSESISRSVGGGSGGGDKGDAGKAFHFDPSGLERAAKAARELDQSRHAQDAFNVIQQQEKTEQLKLQAQMAAYESEAKRLEMQRVAIQEEERRKTLELETSHMKYRAQEQDKLARKRQEEQIAAQQAMQQEQLRKQEESLQKQEAMRRATIEYEMGLKRQLEMDKVKADYEGKVKYERENRELHLEQLREKAREARETTLQSIKAAGELIGNGVNEFIKDEKKVMATVGGLSLLALGIYSARASTGVIARVVESRIGKPSLIRETSRQSPITWLKHPIKTVMETYKRSKAPTDPLESIVLAPTVEERIRSVAWTTIYARQNRAPYRNILLYGPPGTGKTMFAKSLARSSNMDYAILTGGDIAPLGRSAVTELHKLFDWASTSRRGLLLFIDEADAFLRKRSETNMSEDMRNALNAFLYRTGESNKRFMIILASNQPEQLDWAINDRVDELVQFPVPGLDERFRIIKQYFNQHIVDHSKLTGAKTISAEGIDDELLHKISSQTHGFSGRELSKLVVAWQASAYGSMNAVLTAEKVLDITKNYVFQHNQRHKWVGVQAGSS